MADPTSFADADSATLRDTLIDNWLRDVLIRVIVILNQDRLGDEHITFQVDSILRGYDTIGAYVATVIKQDRGIARAAIIGDIEPRALFHGDRVTQANSGRLLATQPARKVK